MCHEFPEPELLDKNTWVNKVPLNMGLRLDILLTNSDNWGNSLIRKNYHGLRVHLNDDQDNFDEVFCYPFYGATKAIARDFDNDGDLDIAAISFYSDDEAAVFNYITLIINQNYTAKGSQSEVMA